MDPPTFSPVDNSEATVVEWACKALNSGNHDFFIQGNHIDNIGENAMACFIHQLTVRIGRSVRIEYVDSQDLWHVMAPLEPVAPPARAITSVVRKKPPRPMNCFIMYRDHEYKRLKALHPELSVQRICKSSVNHPSIIRQSSVNHFGNLLTHYSPDRCSFLESGW